MIGQQSSVGGHDRAAKLQPQAAIEIKPERAIIELSFVSPAGSVIAASLKEA